MSHSDLAERFRAAVNELSLAALGVVLPQITETDVARFGRDWLAGRLEHVDAANMLAAADVAEQVLNLPGHASAMYEIGLEQMARHPEMIAPDVGCADASLNLLGLLYQGGRYDELRRVALRALSLPIDRDEQRVRFAWYLSRVGEAVRALALYEEAMRSDPEKVAAETGLPRSEVEQIGMQVRALARLPSSPPRLRPEVGSAVVPTAELLAAAFAEPPLWDARVFFEVHYESYQMNVMTAHALTAVLPQWKRACEANAAGDYRAAIAASSDAIAGFPVFVEAHGLLIQCWLRAGEPAAAVEAFTKAQSILQNDYPELHGMCGEALLALGRTQEAIVELIKEVHVTGPSEVLLRAILGAWLKLLPQTLDVQAYRAARGELEGALACAGRLLSLRPDQQMTSLLARLCARYALIGPVIPHHLVKLTGLTWRDLRATPCAHTDL